MYQEDTKSTHYKLQALLNHSPFLGCTNRCLTDPSFSCSNRGRCLNQYIKTGCDCRGTGFTGTTCQKRKSFWTFNDFFQLFGVPQEEFCSLRIRYFRPLVFLIQDPIQRTTKHEGFSFGHCSTNENSCENGKYEGFWFLNNTQRS